MSLATLVTQKQRRPSARVYLDGRQCRVRDQPGAITLSQVFGQAVSSGTVTIVDPPVTPVIGMAIRWVWGYNGSNTAGFNGYVTRVTRRSYPNTWTLTVADPLWKAQLVQQDIVTDPLNSITAKAAVEQILGSYGGITAMDIPALEANGSAWAGSAWVLGTLTPVSFSGTTAAQAAQDICSVLGYWLYADRGGTVRAVQLDGRPSSSPFRTFQQGTDLLIEGAPEREQDGSQIYNKVVVLGANTGVEGAQIKEARQTDHPLLPSGVYREYQFSSSLIEYVNESQAGEASAVSVAQRVLGVQSRNPNAVKGRVKADPRLQVGMTVAIKSSRIGYGNAQPFFVYSLQTSFGGAQFDQQLVLDGGVGSEGYTLIPPPVAAFTWELFRENLNGVDTIEVFVDGSPSYSLSEGEIVSYAWTDNGDPQTGSGQRYVFFYENGVDPDPEITLTVTDTTSKEGSTTQTIPLAGDGLTTPQQRAISFAAGSTWYMTSNGGEVWHSESDDGDAIATPPISAMGSAQTGEQVAAADAVGFLATRDTGGTGVRNTIDYLSTDSVTLDDIGASINFLWHSEADAARITAAAGDTVYQSTDSGETFIAVGTPVEGTDVLWVVEPELQPGFYETLVGSNVYWGSGSSWNLVLEGPTDSTAKCYASGFEKHWVGFTGVGTGQSALRSIEGDIATFPALTPEVLNIRALTMLVTVATLYAYDDQGRIFAVDATTGTVTQQTATTGTLPGATPQHAIRDPDYDLVYVSTNEALKKHFYTADAVFAFKSVTGGEQGHMAGYGGLGRTVVKASILLITQGGGTGNDGVWYLPIETGVWELRSTGLPAGAYWRKIVASPFDGNQWLLWGNSADSDVYDSDSANLKMSNGTSSPLWYTADAGATWTAVDVPVYSTYAYQHALSDVEWDTTTGGTWYLAGYGRSAEFYFTGGVIIWRGTAGTAGTPFDVLPLSGGIQPHTYVTTFITPGVGNDVILSSAIAGAGSMLAYIAGGATSATEIGNITYPHQARFERAPGTSRFIVGVTYQNGNGFWASTDYRSTAPTLKNSNDGESVAYLGDGNAYQGDRTSPVGTNDLLKITDPTGTADVTQVTGAAGRVGFVRADRQTRQTLAVRADPANRVDVYVYDGITWAPVTGPAASSAATLRNYVEIIGSA